MYVFSKSTLNPSSDFFKSVHIRARVHFLNVQANFKVLVFQSFCSFSCILRVMVLHSDRSRRFKCTQMKIIHNYTLFLNCICFLYTQEASYIHYIKKTFGCISMTLIIFLYSYEAEFIQSLLSAGKKHHLSSTSHINT